MAHHCLVETTDQVMQVLWDSIVIYTAISDPKSVCTHLLMRRGSGLNKNVFGIVITKIASNVETMTKQAAPSTIPLAYCDSRKESSENRFSISIEKLLPKVPFKSLNHQETAPIRIGKRVTTAKQCLCNN